MPSCRFFVIPAAMLLVSGFQPWLAFGAGFAPVLPAPEGPHPIGTRTIYLAPGGGAAARGRLVTVQLWYPAAERTGRPVSYLPERELLDSMVDDGYMNLESSTLEAWGRLETHAALGAPLAAGSDWPLILAAHGFGVARSQYTTLVEELASHGAVVAMLERADLGLGVTASGRVVSSRQVPQGEELAISRARELAAEAGWVLDVLLDPERAPTLLAGRLDRERIGFFGHSLGGAAALHGCARDQRIGACANLDGHPFGLPLANGLEKPLLIVLGKPTPATEPLGPMGRERKTLWESLLADRMAPAAVVTVSDTMHLSFSDFPWIVPPERMASSGGRMPQAELHRLLTRSLRAFFAEAWQSGERQSLEEVVHEVPQTTLEMYSKQGEGHR